MIRRSSRAGRTSRVPRASWTFPLQDAVIRGLLEPEGRESGILRVYESLARDFLYPDPSRLVVFPDNHDMSRIFTQLGERLDLYRMAMILFATTRGTPQFFYGSEILMTNPLPKADGVLRKDFPGGWAGDATNAFKGEGLTPDQRAAQDFTRALLNWRKDATAIHAGALTQYVPQDGVYVYFRQDNRQTILVALNKSEQERHVDPARFAESIRGNRSARDVLGGQEHDPSAGLTLPPRTAKVLELGGAPPVPPGVTGILRTHENMPSRFVDARRIDVWLPPGYEQDPLRRFPVLYMHDGQNLFDPALSYIGVDWGMDEVLTRLAAEGRIREAIVVGIWNTPKRFQEYMPAKAITESGLPESWPDMAWMQKERVVSDDYLRFLVEELKPFIDTTYRTLPGRGDTAIMGSSMGAFISLYALTEYPDVFGGAGCVSTHWPLGDGLVIDYLVRHLPGTRRKPYLLRLRHGDARCRLRAIPAAD